MLALLAIFAQYRLFEVNQRGFFYLEKFYLMKGTG